MPSHSPVLPSALPSTAPFLQREPTRWAFPCARAAFLPVFPTTDGFLWLQGTKCQSWLINSNAELLLWASRKDVGVEPVCVCADGNSPGLCDLFWPLACPPGRVFPCRVSQSRLCFATFPRWSVSLSHLFPYRSPEVTLQSSAHLVQQVKATERGRITKYLVLGQRMEGPAGVSRTGKPRTGPRLSWISQHRSLLIQCGVLQEWDELIALLSILSAC